jgi:hypothetical protein
MTFDYFMEVARWRARAFRHRVRKGLGLLPRPLPEEKPLVFGIGMHRTGTRSLCEYLDDLGYHSLHWPHWCEWDLKHNLGRDNRAIMRLLDPLFYEYDCFTDVPFAGLYRELDQRFPRGRFILTIRDSQSWWRSVVRHWGLATTGARPLDPGETIQYRLYEPVDKTRIRMDDRETQIAKFERHNSDVQEHFTSRPGRLLVVDLADGRKNEKISAFLGKPTKPYPHVQDNTRPPGVAVA